MSDSERLGKVGDTSEVHITQVVDSKDKEECCICGVEDHYRELNWQNKRSWICDRCLTELYHAKLVPEL